MTDATRLAIGQPCESCGQKIRGLPAIQTQTGYRHTHWMHLKGVPPMSMCRPFTGLPVTRDQRIVALAMEQRHKDGEVEIPEWGQSTVTAALKGARVTP